MSAAASPSPSPSSSSPPSPPSSSGEGSAGPIGTSRRRPRPLVLCVLDGVGERAEREGNAVALAETPHLSALARECPRTVLGASGADVGLPAGHPGSSAAGHLSLGAGRVPLTEHARIGRAIEERRFGANEVIAGTFRIAKEHLQSRLHLFCTVSASGVHASLDHLREIIRIASLHQVSLVLHAFLDGPGHSAGGQLLQLEELLRGVGVIGTLSGRHYAMDRDERWDRVHKAYTAIVRGEALRAGTVQEALREAAEAGFGDEMVPPIRIGDYEGIKGDFVADFSSGQKPVWEWYGEEVGLSLNARPDRMRQLSAMLARRGLPAEVEGWLSDRGKAVHAFQQHCYRCLTEHDPALRLPVAFPREQVSDSFAEVIARAGLKQLRCGESEKAAHVTWMFSGGREEPFLGEERRLVASPRDVSSYRSRPEMSAPEVAQRAAEAIRGGDHDFILVNFANPDAVAHTGDLAAAIRAVEAVDAGVGAIAAAVREVGGALLVTSAHGNCEQMQDSLGKPHEGHTQNPVPLYYLNDDDIGVALRSGGRIADVAPTMLEILGVPRPEAMTGRSLRVRA